MGSTWKFFTILDGFLYLIGWLPVRYGRNTYGTCIIRKHVRSLTLKHELSTIIVSSIPFWKIVQWAKTTHKLKTYQKIWLFQILISHLLLVVAAHQHFLHVIRHNNSYFLMTQTDPLPPSSEYRVRRCHVKIRNGNAKKQSNRGDGGVTLTKFSIRLCPSRHLQTVVTPCGFFQELSWKTCVFFLSPVSQQKIPLFHQKT